MQENTQLKVKNWQSSNPDSSFYFRPFVESIENKITKEEEVLQCHQSSTSSQQQGKQTLLCVHQEQWQKHLLERYGGTMVMLNATY